MPTVLLVGDDEFLLETRAAVVRTTGANTLCCSSKSALEIQQHQPCDVVILCHSLPAELRSALCSLIHDRWPDTRLLVLSSIRGESVHDGVEFADAVNSADPEELVSRTIELLRKGPASEKSLHRSGSIRLGL